MIQAVNQVTFELLESRLRILLPEQYQDRYDDVQPVSMKSAELKFGKDGRVAWDEIWGSFCDLAMAGGPPHRGTLLEPGLRADINTDPSRYRQAVDEICRGITLVSGLGAEPSPAEGWVRVTGASWGMAEWLVRAIAMENISVRTSEGATLDVPVGPAYRIEKEIKNVITSVAKTCHYWRAHMSDTQRRMITELLSNLAKHTPLVQPERASHSGQVDGHLLLKARMSETIFQLTGLRSSDHSYTGWLGIDVQEVHAAVWMMRLLVASNLLARREGTNVFVSFDSGADPDGEIVTQRLLQVYSFWQQVTFGASAT